MLNQPLSFTSKAKMNDINVNSIKPPLTYFYELKENRPYRSGRLSSFLFHLKLLLLPYHDLHVQVMLNTESNTNVIHSIFLLSLLHYQQLKK